MLVTIPLLLLPILTTALVTQVSQGHRSVDQFPSTTTIRITSTAPTVSPAVSSLGPAGLEPRRRLRSRPPFHRTKPIDAEHREITNKDSVGTAMPERIEGPQLFTAHYKTHTILTSQATGTVQVRHVDESIDNMLVPPMIPGISATETPASKSSTTDELFFAQITLSPTTASKSLAMDEPFLAQTTLPPHPLAQQHTDPKHGPFLLDTAQTWTTSIMTAAHVLRRDAQTTASPPVVPRDPNHGPVVVSGMTWPSGMFDIPWKSTPTYNQTTWPSSITHPTLVPGKPVLGIPKQGELGIGYSATTTTTTG
jgi:hypothetical protein